MTSHWNGKTKKLFGICYIILKCVRSSNYQLDLTACWYGLKANKKTKQVLSLHINNPAQHISLFYDPIHQQLLNMMEPELMETLATVTTKSAAPTHKAHRRRAGLLPSIYRRGNEVSEKMHGSRFCSVVLMVLNIVHQVMTLLRVGD